MKVPIIIKQAAHKLRVNPTQAEIIMWEKIRKNKLVGLRFVRQKPILVQYDSENFGRYIIADFYCPEYKAIIELDGSIHNLQEVERLDREKEALLKNLGYTVLRFRNNDVLSGIEISLEKIVTSLLGNQSGEFKGGFGGSCKERKFKGELKEKRKFKEVLGDSGKEKGFKGELKKETKHFTMINDSFICENCKEEVPKHPTGSARNHCPYCLYSKHLDARFPGDRASECYGNMKPIKKDYHKNKGWMVVHECVKCGKQIPNKLAEDDDMEVFSKI